MIGGRLRTFSRNFSTVLGNDIKFQELSKFSIKIFDFVLEMYSLESDRTRNFFLFLEKYEFLILSLYTYLYLLLSYFSIFFFFFYSLLNSNYLSFTYLSSAFVLCFSKCFSFFFFFFFNLLKSRQLALIYFYDCSLLFFYKLFFFS